MLLVLVQRHVTTVGIHRGSLKAGVDPQLPRPERVKRLAVRRRACGPEPIIRSRLVAQWFSRATRSGPWMSRTSQARTPNGQKRIHVAPADLHSTSFRASRRRCGWRALQVTTPLKPHPARPVQNLVEPVTFLQVTARAARHQSMGAEAPSESRAWQTGGAEGQGGLDSATSVRRHAAWAVTDESSS
jgi:hypothetical protein